MKRFVLLFVALSLLLPASASADWKEFLKNRVPGVRINIPNPTSKTGRPVRVDADGNGVRTNRMTGGAIVAATNNAAYAAPGYTGGTGGSTTSAQQTPSSPYSGDENGIVIVPPENGGTNEIPSFAGTVVAVRNQRFHPLRIVDLEAKIQHEFAKRGASVVRTPLGYAGNPCDIGRPVICVSLQDPLPGPAERENGYSGYSSYGRNNYWYSSGGSGGQFQNYHVGVIVELWLGDGSAPHLLAGAAKNFAATESSYSNSYYSSSNSRSNGSNYSYGSSSSSQYGDDVVGKASRAAKKAADHVLKNKKDWFPGAAELVRQVFRQ